MDAVESKIYIGILIIGFLVAFVLFLLFYRVTRQQYRFIREERKKYAEDLKVAEHEQKRIGYDLHDEIGPELGLLNFTLKEMNSTDVEILKLKALALESVQEIKNKMEGITRNLSMHQLNGAGLEEAIQKFLESVHGMTGKEIKYRYEVSGDLREPIAMHIFRIIKELVHNSLKHASADTIEVHVKTKGNFLYLYYFDDGSGMIVDEKNIDGLGLQSIGERVRKMGGHLESIPGGGTEFFIHLPIKHYE